MSNNGTEKEHIIYTDVYAIEAGHDGICLRRTVTHIVQFLRKETKYAFK